jgi:hypothetical protein
MRRKMRIVLFLFVGLVVGPTAALSNTPYVYSPQFCSAEDDGHPSIERCAIQKFDYGIQNMDPVAEDCTWQSGDGNTHAVLCPVGPITNFDILVDSFTVFYFDGDPFEAMSCSVRVTSSAGGAYISSSRFSCSTAGGCSGTSGASYKGQNYLHLDNPFGAMVLTNTKGLVVVCSIPGRDNAFGGYSGLYSYAVNLTL